MTKILQDGDLVEVDADVGIVRILEKKEKFVEIQKDEIQYKENK